MDVFAIRDALLEDYRTYVQSFITIRDTRIAEVVETSLDEGYLWPDPLIQMNPAFQSGATIDTLVDEDVLHPECRTIFRMKHNRQDALGTLIRLHHHQEEAIRIARDSHCTRWTQLYPDYGNWVRKKFSVYHPQC